MTMNPGIITLGSLGQEGEDVPAPLMPPSFKPTVTVPWLASLPAPIVAGLIGDAVAGPITKATSDDEIRVRNGVAAVTTGAASFFSWKAALDPEVYMGLRIAAGMTGVFWGLTAILAFFSTIAPGPFVKTETEFSRVKRYLIRTR